MRRQTLAVFLGVLSGIIAVTFLAAVGVLSPGERTYAQGVSTTAVHDAYAFESITVSTTAVRISASLVAPTGAQAAKQAYCTVLTNSINIRFDGTDPTSSVGHTYAAGTNFSLWGSTNITRLRAIRVSADGTLQCTLLR